MYRDHSVGVVVPAYDEEGFVGDVIETVPDYVDRIYAIDDRSTDGTWAEILAAAGRSDVEAGTTDAEVGPADAEVKPTDAEATTTDGGAAAVAGSASGEADAPDWAAGESADDRTDVVDADGVRANRADAPADRVVAIRHGSNRGVGGAIKTGYLAAREADLDVVAVVGGDGQMDPDYLDRLLDPIVEGRADYVKGNRLLDADHHADMPRHRLVGNGILTLLTKIATGYWSIGDPQMGYTAIAGESLGDVGVEDMYEYYGYCNDLLVRHSTAGYRVADVPCPLDYADETSHISYREYVPRVSAMLLRSFLRRIWSGRGSATGAARLALFVGGAVATVVGIASALAGGTGGESEDEGATYDPEIDDDRRDSGRTTLLGVVALLAAMLVDGVSNASHNYTEPGPEEE